LRCPSPPTGEAAALYDLIMAYRADNGLPSIPLSRSLTIVAQTHVEDLIAYRSEVLVGTCNLHSWSNHGPWQGCCYTPDHAQASCMWNKPRELTVYTGDGYEISASGVSQAQSALNLWKNSSGHNAVILNQGSWSTPWKAIGIGMGGGYAHVWFGRNVDPG